MVNASEGQYYYARHRSMWGVWRAGKEINGFRDDDFIKDFVNKEDARKYVYQLNGWFNSR